MTNRNMFTSNVLMQPEFSTCSLKEWQRANLERIIQDPRDGKDDGGLTPPISRLLSECIPFSDVAAVVAATEQSKASLLPVLSVSTRPAPYPSFVPLDSVPTTPLPPPLMLALLAGLMSHIVGQRR
jgi:hypothetical protein